MLTLEQLENSIYNDFYDWQDSDSDDGNRCPSDISYVLIKEALELPQEPVNTYSFLDKITWSKGLSDYCLLREIGYGHFTAIEELARIHTRKNH